VRFTRALVVVVVPEVIGICKQVPNVISGSEEPVRVFSGTNLLGTADAPSYTLVVSGQRLHDSVN
jgi:hypothetical protein